MKLLLLQQLLHHKVVAVFGGIYSILFDVELKRRHLCEVYSFKTSQIIFNNYKNKSKSSLEREEKKNERERDKNLDD